MKTCTICKQSKALSEFNKHSGRKDGLQSHCRGCSHKKFKDYYHKNKEKQYRVVKDRQKRVLVETRQEVVNYLMTHPCVDCGQTDIRLLEFDHREDKVKAVTTMIHTGYSIENIRKEIAKCDVRCCNCHRLKTYERMGNTWHDKFLTI